MSSGGETFTNPVIYEDLADLEIIRVEDTYYYTASTMHFSPGAPLLKSYDLINWEYISNSVPKLNFGPEYSLKGKGSPSAYVGGVWASTIGYRKSNGLFYWYGCIQSENKTHVFTAKSPEGPWTQHTPIDVPYYDCGLLIDPDDDTMYIAYGATTLRIAQLSPDGLSEVRNEEIYQEPTGRLIEGSRFYKVNGSYYVFADKPVEEQHILKSSTGPFGKYEIRTVISGMSAPVPGAGPPHQGCLIDTSKGEWYYMAFIDAFPLGRCPVLAPVTWDAEGWPHVVADDTDSNSWGVKYPLPVSTTKKLEKSSNFMGAYSEDFAAQRHTVLNRRWEWNHDPIDEGWGFTEKGLELGTAAISPNLYLAPNTLTHRTLGPKSQATFQLDISGMVDGDRAGAAILRDHSAYIGIHKDGDKSRLVFVDGLILEESSRWKPTDAPGTIAAEGPRMVSEPPIVWLRVKADVRPAHWKEHRKESRKVTFWYSTDGTEFTQLGPEYALDAKWQFFMAYRFALFNYATKAMGGSVVLKHFNLELWD